VRRAEPAGATVEEAKQQGPTVPAGRIRIERLILHGLDNRLPAPRLVDEPVLLTDEIAQFFALHISAAAARADWQGRFIDMGGEVPQWCAALLNGHDDFIAASHLLARRLFNHMRPRTIAPGDLAVMVYTAGDESLRHVALLKIDPDQRLARTFTSRGGKTRVSIEVAGNLLPDTAHLQKCALLRARQAGGPFDVTILDTQASPKADGVAAFFYRGFLTAELVPSARRHTREFIHCCDLWLASNREQFTPADLSTFYAARRAALARDVVHPEQFAEDALPNRTALRSLLEAHLEDTLRGGGEPAAGFQVDPATAAGVVNRVTLELDGGARLSVPADRFAELVRIAPARTAENKYRIVIESLTLKEVSDR
jgi:hypothetical protein